MYKELRNYTQSGSYYWFHGPLCENTFEIIFLIFQKYVVCPVFLGYGGHVSTLHYLSIPEQFFRVLWSIILLTEVTPTVFRK